MSDVVTVLPKDSSGDSIRIVHFSSTEKLVLVWCFAHCIVWLKPLNYRSG